MKTVRDVDTFAVDHAKQKLALERQARAERQGDAVAKKHMIDAHEIWRVLDGAESLKHPGYSWELLP